jgi:serine/threonine protein kinase
MRTVGSYQILEQLGEGAMGAVYRAVDVHLDRIVALKSVRREVARQPQFIERFREEAKIQARLESPHIVRVYQFLQDADEYFMVMEFVNGYSLAKLLADEGRIAPEQAVALLIQTLDGLGYAHERNVVHRDVKPANIMVNDEGIVKVADFGIARVLGSSRQRLTQVGGVVGTLEYMSPETLMGEDATAASDVYSCGIVAYQLLSGVLPFKHDNDWALVEMHRNQAPAPLPELPKPLEAAIMRALAKKPADRFRSAGAMAKALGAWLQTTEGSTQLDTGQWNKLRALSSTRISGETGLSNLAPPSSAGSEGRRRAVSAVSRRVSELLAQQHWQEAQSELDKNLAAFPAETTLFELRDRIARERTRYEEDIRTALQEGQALLQRGLPDVAKSALETSLRRYPGHAELTDLLSRAELELMARAAGSSEVGKVATRVGELLQREQFQEAVRFIADAVGRLPNQPELVTLLSRTVQAEREHTRQQAINACREKVLSFQKLAEWGKAFEAIDSALTQHPNDPVLLDLRAATERERQAQLRSAEIEFILIQVDEFKNKNELDAAEEILQGGLTRFPDDASLSNALTSIRNRKEKARRRAVADAAIQRAGALREKSEWDNALEVVAKALQEAPGDVDLEAFRVETEQIRDRHAAELRAAVEDGSALLRAGRLEDALVALSEASQRYPQDPAILKLLLEAQQKLAAERRERQLQQVSSKAADLLAAGSFDEAEQLLLDAIPQFPDDARLTRTLSAAIQGRRDLEKKRFASKCLERAQGLASENKLGEAVQELESGLSRYPDEPTLQKQRREFAATLRERQRVARLSALRESVGRLVGAQDFGSALAEISQALTEYPDDPEFKSLETSTREAQRSHEQQRAETDAEKRVAAFEKDGQYDQAWSLVQSAFALYPNSTRLAQLRDAIDQHRQAAVRKSSEQGATQAVAESIAARKWSTAEAAVADFERTYGKDPFSTRLRDQISAASKGRAAELTETLGKVTELTKQKDYAAALDLLAATTLDEAEAASFQQVREKAQTGLQQQRVEAGLAELGTRVASAIEKGDTGEAQRALEGASKEIRSHPGYGELQKKVQREEGIVAALFDASALLSAHSWTKASELLDGAKRSLGDDPRLADLAARVSREQKQHEESIQTFLAEARSLSDSEQYDKALERLNKAIADFPNEPALQRALAETQQRTPAFRRAAKLSSIEAAAQSLLTQRQWERAETILQDALRDLPGEGRLLDLLHTAQTARQLEEGIQNCTKTVQVHLEANDPDRAREILAEALQKFPDNKALLDLNVSVVMAQAARRLDADRPKAALQALEALGPRAQADPVVRALDAKCRQKIQLQEDQLRQAVSKAESLLQKDQCDEALGVLVGTPAELQGDQRLRDIRNRAEALGAVQRQAADEIAEIRKLLKSAGPEAALKKLQEAGQATRRRPDFAALEKECRVELKKWQAATRVVDAGSLRAPEQPAPAAPLEKQAPEKQPEKKSKSKAAQRESKPPEPPAPKVVPPPQEPKPAVVAVPPTRLAEVKKPLPWKLIVGGVGAVAAAIVVAVLMNRPSAPKPDLSIRVEIRTDPPGASVRVGDQSCTTPNCTVTLLPGNYQVQAELQGFESASKPLTLTAGKTADVVNLPLQPVIVPQPPPDPTKASGTLVVQTGLDGALVYIDGAARGRTDLSGTLRMDLDAGTHQVRVQKESYAAAEKPAKIAEHRSLTLSFKLIAELARLEIKGAPAGVEVRAGGTLLGRTDGNLFSHEVQTGDRVVQVTEGAASRELPEHFAPGQTVSIDWSSIAPPKAVTPPPVNPPITTNLPPPQPPVANLPKPVDPAEQDWERLRNSSDIAELENFMNKYSSSPRAAEARALRDRLQQDALKAKQANEEKQRAEAAQAAQARLAADRKAVLDTLKLTEQAYGARNMTQLSAVWPVFASSAGVVKLFADKDVTKVTMELKPLGDPQISGDTARVPVERTMTQTYKQGSPPQPPKDRPTVNLVRKAQGWVIDSVK